MNQQGDFVQFLFKEYEYHLHRIGVCQDVAKSIVLRAVAMIVVVGVGAWKWLKTVNNPELYHGLGCIAVTGIVLAGVVGYAVFSMYITWLDRRMNEFKLNRIRKWFFQGQQQAFDVDRYRKLSRMRRKPAWRDFAYIRRGKMFGNPWLLNSASIILFGFLCFMVVVVFVLAEMS